MEHDEVGATLVSRERRQSAAARGGLFERETCSFYLQRETNFKENEFYFIFVIQISKP